MLFSCIVGSPPGLLEGIFLMYFATFRCFVSLLKPSCYFVLVKLCDVILFVSNPCVLKIHLNEVVVFSISFCCCCLFLIILCCGHSFMIDETLGYLELTKHIMHYHASHAFIHRCKFLILALLFLSSP